MDNSIPYNEVRFEEFCAMLACELPVEMEGISGEQCIQRHEEFILEIKMHPKYRYLAAVFHKIRERMESGEKKNNSRSNLGDSPILVTGECNIYVQKSSG